jgi:hypothetical protein
MAKIFVSHAHEDKVAARQIAHALAEAGLEPWLDEREMRSGNELLRTISTVLIEADYFVIVLSRTALTKPWVLTEMRMALTAEIEKGRPKVIVLRLNDCELPIELLHKLYLDLRGRFEEGLKDLSGHMGGVARATSVPKQTVLAQMITNADAELWRRLSAGSGARDELTKTEAANVIRDLRSGEMEAAVAIGHQ